MADSCFRASRFICASVVVGWFFAGRLGFEVSDFEFAIGFVLFVGLFVMGCCFDFLAVKENKE
ncbi:MAG: hypothetical protein FWE23_09510 [Chitinivibrionia bacterium]|nr:hypothetical protein [Chitinivibrionia bacterium]